MGDGDTSDTNDTKAVNSRNSARQTQQGAQTMQSRLENYGTDPDYITDLEHWPGISHQEIFHGINSIDIPGMHDYAKSWLDIAAKLGGGLFGLNISIQKTLSDAFEGHIADAATQATQKFSQQVTDTQEVIDVVGARIHAAAYGAEAAKYAVPPNVAVSDPNQAINFTDIVSAAANAATASVPGALPTTPSICQRVQYGRATDTRREGRLVDVGVTAANTLYQQASAGTFKMEAGAAKRCADIYVRFEETIDALITEAGHLRVSGDFGGFNSAQELQGGFTNKSVELVSILQSIQGAALEMAAAFLRAGQLVDEADAMHMRSIQLIPISNGVQ